MELNYIAILVCAIVAMIVGFIWYGPLFGKVWMRVMNVNPNDAIARKEMQKSAMPLYILQFILTLIQVFIMAQYIKAIPQVLGLQHGLVLWLAFVLPLTAGTAMWNMDGKRVAWIKFALQAGYQLVLFILFGLILGAWD